MDKVVKKWIEERSSGDGAGYGYGCGYCIYGNDGAGEGSGYCNDDGVGAGYGYGSDSGDGPEDDSGYGYGYDVAMFCGEAIYTIDEVQTLIYRVVGNLAKGAILHADMTLTPCYIVRDGKGKFAHGETPEAAQEALLEKIYDCMDIDEAVDTMLAEMELGKKYPASEFYRWHHILTGSCEMGRRLFMRDHGINMTDEYTIEEFAEIVKNDFGSDRIAVLINKIKGMK